MQKNLSLSHKVIVILWLLITPCLAANAARIPGQSSENPLKPIDMSSPRATIEGFLKSMDEAYQNSYGVLFNYLKSGNLFVNTDEMNRHSEYLAKLDTAERTLDLSELPPAMQVETARRLTVQLKEILDRLELPPLDSIPDAKAMAASGATSWTVPNSEIRIYKVDQGPRSGQYLFGPETVKRLPDFYNKIKHLPYRENSSPYWYEYSANRPIAVAILLHNIVPTRWLVDLPEWAITTVLEQPIWRWFAIFLVLSVAVAFVTACFKFSRNYARNDWQSLLRPISLVVAAPLTAFLLNDILRISSPVYEWAGLSLNILFYLSMAWAVWTIGGVLAESVISFERLRVGSIDGQLIRLVIRLLTLIAAIFILVTGADRIGLPAYSVVAGLGVGGLAFALAAQQTLANLIGSLIIMFEKPFTIGNTIKVKDTEGKVESVGFRSTRIRTSKNSIVTIPSSDLVSSTIDNLDRREYRPEKFILRVPYGLPCSQLEAFIESIQERLENHPQIIEKSPKVELNSFGAGNVEIQVRFDLKIPETSSETKQRHTIFLEILKLAETENVKLV